MDLFFGLIIGVVIGIVAIYALILWVGKLASKR
jgi:hypothetical protein